MRRTDAYTRVQQNTIKPGRGVASYERHVTVGKYMSSSDICSLKSTRVHGKENMLMEHIHSLENTNIYSKIYILTENIQLMF